MLQKQLEFVQQASYLFLLYTIIPNAKINNAIRDIVIFIADSVRPV